MNVVRRIEIAGDRVLADARARWRTVDRAWRAWDRYLAVSGGRLAAATAYYGFFAVFALALVAYAVLGYLVEYNLDLSEAVDDFLSLNLPWLEPADVRGSRSRIGLVGLIGLVVTGVSWIDAIRSAVRLIFGLAEQPGHPVIRWLRDLVVLVGLFVLLGTSLVAAYGVEAGLSRLVGGSSPGVRAVSWLLALVVNLILATALLVAVPQLRLPARRLRWPVMLVGCGVMVLNTLGQLVIGLVRANAAYTVVTSAVGVLVYLYLFNQLLMYGAAIAATSERGTVVDLALPRPGHDAPRPEDAPQG